MIKLQLERMREKGIDIAQFPSATVCHIGLKGRRAFIHFDYSVIGYECADDYVNQRNPVPLGVAGTYEDGLKKIEAFLLKK